MKEGLEQHWKDGKVDPDDMPDLGVGAPDPKEQQLQEQHAPVAEQPVVEETQEEPVVEITDEPQEVAPEAEVTSLETVETIEEEPSAPAPLSNNLPEGIDKLVDFLNETGGTLQDYVALNKSYDELDDDTLLKEYYTKTKPHLDQEDVNFLLSKKFKIDEELMEEDEVREKKIALKEELSKAKYHLNTAKDKYYEDLKANGGAIATNEAEESAKKAVFEHFQSETEKVFEGFKGFTFDLGEGKQKIRYKTDHGDKIKETQSDINNVIKPFFGEDGKLTDAQGYHKALFAAQNADKIAALFYEQGKADAIQANAKDSKNLDFSNTHRAPSSNTKLQPGQAREINQNESRQGIRLKYTKF